MDAVKYMYDHGLAGAKIVEEAIECAKNTSVPML